jgi:hypothetical protein
MNARLLSYNMQVLVVEDLGPWMQLLHHFSFDCFFFHFPRKQPSFKPFLGLITVL